MKRFTVIAVTVGVASAPAVAQARPHYKTCRPASRFDRLVAAKTGTSCALARRLEIVQPYGGHRMAGIRWWKVSTQQIDGRWDYGYFRRHDIWPSVVVQTIPAA